MPYKEMVVMDITDLIRRIKDGQSVRAISKATGRDRKTVQKYKELIETEQAQIAMGEEPKKAIGLKELMALTATGSKRKEKQNLFLPFKEEITKYLQAEKKYGLKLKSIYEVIVAKHDISTEVSLSSFKRFLKSNDLLGGPVITCRLVKEAGVEIQIDYAKVGMSIDPGTKKKRTVYVFIGTLVSSKHKFAEFVYKQDQRSFVESHVKMFEFFRGVAKVLTIDNLKAGVITPDRYDPKINKSYGELAEHYNCFVNPCRVASPKDKGVVERDVQTIREEYKKMIVLFPDIMLVEANLKIKEWLKGVYGLRKHGSTGLFPYEEFIQTEQPSLLKLPEGAFELAVWKRAKVHPDCFVQVNKKSYSVHYQYVGKTTDVKVKTKTVEIYHDGMLIKTHIIPKKNREIDYADFPENMQKSIDSGLPAYLQQEADLISGENLRSLIVRLLTPHAFINLRRAQGILSVAKKYDRRMVEQAAGIFMEEAQATFPKEFESMILSLEAQREENLQDIMISEQTREFLRSETYYTKQAQCSIK